MPSYAINTDTETAMTALYANFTGPPVVAYNYVKYTIKNNNSTKGDFGIIYDFDKKPNQKGGWVARSTDTQSINPGKTADFYIRNLQCGSNIRAAVARKNATGGWDAQMPAAEATAKTNPKYWIYTVNPRTDIKVVGQSSRVVVVNWAAGIDPLTKFVLTYQPTLEVGTSSHLKVVDLPASSAKGGIMAYQMKKLVRNTSYTVTVYIRNDTGNTASSSFIGQFVPPNFDFIDDLPVSPLINERIPDLPIVKASTVAISWLGNASQVYRFVLKDATKTPLAIKGDDADTSAQSSYGTLLKDNVQTETGNGTLTFTDLAPNTDYVVVMQQIEQLEDGPMGVDQLEIPFKTKGSALTVNSVSPESIDCSWTMAYSGASYQLRYKVAGTLDSTWIKLDKTQALSQTITGLQEGTSYEVDLFVIEDGTISTSYNSPLGFDMGSYVPSDPLTRKIIVLVAAAGAYYYYNNYYKKK
jgi:hypothetical protein